MTSTETIVRIAARGEGVTPSGRFIAGAAPGDMVDALGLITPGPNRQVPPCQHYARCGGCQLQHINDAAFSDYIVDRISGALHAQGIDLPEIRTPILSPPFSRRRASLRAQKMGKQVILGFAETGSHKLVDLRACPVMHPALFALLQPLRKLLLTLITKRHPVDIRMTLTDQGVDVLISGVEAEGLEVAEMLTAFSISNTLARFSLDEGYGPTARWEPDPVTITLGGVAVGLPEGAFLQATSHGEAALVTAVRAIMGDATPVVDLFAGLGTFALSLGVPVHAVEGARDAAMCLHLAGKRVGRALTTEHRDLFRRPLTAVELSRFGGAILDPPRAGAKEQVDEIARSSVPRVAFISCNPATFARDAKTLIDGGYRLEHIQPVGQFRWSTHVELAAAFTR